MTKILNQTNEYGPFLSATRKGKDVHKFEVPGGESFHSARITILDAHYGGSAWIASAPPAGKTGAGEITVAWLCESCADVKYQVEAFSCPKDAPPNAVPPTRQMTGFLPSINGWPFDNRFEEVPLFKLIGDIWYGNAQAGLCGGMVFAALDYFLAKREIPPIPKADLSPSCQSPRKGKVFKYLGERLIASFDIPVGALTYIALMNPNYPDYQSGIRLVGLTPRSRAWRMVRQEWPKIKAQLDAGQPCPLGLIRVKSRDLSKLGDNHQVLAYGYDVAGDELSLFIYDPNYHQNDNITLKLNIANPDRKITLSYRDPMPVYCFFLTGYTRSTPP